jgi:hypothetical protein
VPENQPNQLDPIGATPHGACPEVADSELAAAIVGEQTVAFFEQESATFLVIGARRGADAEQAELLGARHDARKRVPDDFMQSYASGRALGMKNGRTEQDHAVAGGGSGREVGDPHESRGEPERPDERPDRAHEAAWVALVFRRDLRLTVTRRQRGPLPRADLRRDPGRRSLEREPARRACLEVGGSDGFGDRRFSLDLARSLGVLAAEPSLPFGRVRDAIEGTPDLGEPGGLAILPRRDRGLPGFPAVDEPLELRSGVQGSAAVDERDEPLGLEQLAFDRGKSEVPLRGLSRIVGGLRQGSNPHMPRTVRQGRPCARRSEYPLRSGRV